MPLVEDGQRTVAPAIVVDGRTFRGATEELRKILDIPSPIEFRDCEFLGCGILDDGPGVRRRYVRCLFSGTTFHVRGDGTAFLGCTFDLTLVHNHRGRTGGWDSRGIDVTT